MTSISLPNFLRDCIYKGSIGRYGSNILLDLSEETRLATAQLGLLMDRLSLLLTGNRMSNRTRATILGAVEQIPKSNSSDRAKLAVYLTSICAESVIQP